MDYAGEEQKSRKISAAENEGTHPRAIGQQSQLFIAGR